LRAARILGIVIIVALAVGSAVYAARHFAIKTDVTDLFPPDLPWTRRGFEFMKAFPQPDVLVVVDAPTPELVEEASNQLAQALDRTSFAAFISSTAAISSNGMACRSRRLRG
jgi:hypothetical protein